MPSFFSRHYKAIIITWFLVLSSLLVIFAALAYLKPRQMSQLINTQSTGSGTVKSESSDQKKFTAFSDIPGSLLLLRFSHEGFYANPSYTDLIKYQFSDGSLEHLNRLPYHDSVTDRAYSRGRIFYRNKMFSLDTGTMETLFEIPEDMTMFSNQQSDHTPFLTRDGNFLLYTLRSDYSHSSTFELHVLEIDSKTDRTLFSGDWNEYLPVTITPDDQRVIAAAYENNDFPIGPFGVRIFNLKDGTFSDTPIPESRYSSDLIFSTDTSQFAVEIDTTPGRPFEGGIPEELYGKSFIKKLYIVDTETGAFQLAFERANNFRLVAWVDDFIYFDEFLGTDVIVSEWENVTVKRSRFDLDNNRIEEDVAFEEESDKKLRIKDDWEVVAEPFKRAVIDNVAYIGTNIILISRSTGQSMVAGIINDQVDLVTVRPE